MIATLNDREVDGYQHVWLPVYAEAADGTRLVVTERALVYVARITNRLFTGCLKHDDIVARVLRCEGKSGPNRAYLTNLAEAADKIGDLDPHLAALVRLLPSATGTSPLLK